MDYSPPRCRVFALNWSLDDDDSSPLQLRVHFVLRWPSMRHRGAGIGGEVLILSIEHQRDASGLRWSSFGAPAQIETAILETLEREELTQ